MRQVSGVLRRPRGPDATGVFDSPGAFQRALLIWYRRGARDLPWRRTRDAYRIWVSEIMLQQTRVETVLGYYARFLAVFPTVQALAQAPLPEVLRVWAGLGYYTRARNLHRAAQMIVNERDGRCPATAAEWRELPGIGRYTAGAIASIAQRECVPAVDGNVKRVLARLFCIREPIDLPATQARLWQLAEDLLPRRAPGDFNQGLMELGARVCTPRGPRCEDCPVKTWCLGHARGNPERLPRRRARGPVRQVEVVVAILRARGRLLLVRRPATGLLAGLWTLPGGELMDKQLQTDALRSILKVRWGLSISVGRRVEVVEHHFSHQHWRVYVYECELERGRLHAGTTESTQWVSPARLTTYPLASLDRKLLRTLTVC